MITEQLLPNPVIRLIRSSDSIAELTLLLRRAYKVLAGMGFNYTATYQDEATTVQRIEGGECYVIADGAALIGTITLHRRLQYSAGAHAWYARREVAICTQFAVDPRLQRHGLGTKLIEFAEFRAIELGAAELALDTAEGAHHLVRFYTNRGYRIIDWVQHQGKTYRSVLLSKALSGTGKSFVPA